jgi:DNA-binding NarL/FixJ family response regulator
LQNARFFQGFATSLLHFKGNQRGGIIAAPTGNMIARTQYEIAVDDRSVSIHSRETTQVWLVDDSENFRTVLAGLLEDEGGMDCSQQFGSAEAMLDALASETPPDVILLDVRMPGMGGLKAIRPIKFLAPSTHVVMLTTFFDPGTKQSAIRDGASALLLKRRSHMEIAAEIRRVARRSPALPAVDVMTESQRRPMEARWMRRKSSREFSLRRVSKQFVRGAASLRKRVLQTFQRAE